MHPPSGPAWAVWLETSAPAVAMRQWLWLYPSIEITHIVGFVVLVGSAFMFDLRLLGLSRALPVSAMATHLLPLGASGPAAGGALRRAHVHGARHRVLAPTPPSSSSSC